MLALDGQALDGELGIPILIPGLVAIGGLSFLTARELTDDTSRLRCVERAMEQGFSEEEALRICGVTGGFLDLPDLWVLIVLGLLIVGAFLLLR